MTKNIYAERYPTYDVWLRECQENPVFRGADFSRTNTLQCFYNDMMLYGPSPGLRRTWEKDLAFRLGAKENEK